MRTIDLNCDMGEFPDDVAGGAQEALMPFITSVNVACGGHAGDDFTMRRTIEQASRWKLSIGAHPGYTDRPNFGRLPIAMSAGAIADMVFEQVRALAKIAAEAGVPIRHVKPHGALYNSAATDPIVARAIADGVGRWNREAVLVGLAGSLMLDVFRFAGFIVAAEAFADRRYEPDATLRPRRHADSLIDVPEDAARQALDIVEHGSLTAVDGSRVAVQANTICIHGDTPGAPAIAAAVARILKSRGIALRHL